MKYIIKGGEFNNKGAEAMSLIAIYNILKNDDNAKIYFLDIGYAFPYNGDIPVIPFKMYYKQIDAILKRDRKEFVGYVFKNTIKNCLKMQSVTFKKIYGTFEILKQADFFIDISGYALSSKWGKNASMYLDWILAVKTVNPFCKVFLMPQSFGPFDYTQISKKQMVKALSLCEIIYAREPGGYQNLLELGLNNVELSYDSVLMERDYKAEAVIENIKKYSRRPNKVEGRKIAIIPNCRLVDIGKREELTVLNIYSKAVEKCCKNATVYLIPHAGEDINLCKAIKERFKEKNVILVDYVMNSFDFEKFVEDFEYIIASRYHSIIHAYRRGTPAVIIGWAEKYDAVSDVFGQKIYEFDIDSGNEIGAIIEKMESRCNAERKKIQAVISDIQKNNCYDFLRADILSDKKHMGENTW